MDEQVGGIGSRETILALAMPAAHAVDMREGDSIEVDGSRHSKDRNAGLDL